MQPLSLSEKETGLQGNFSQCPWRHCHWLGQVSWGRRMSSGMDTLRFRLGSEKPEAQRSCFTSSTSSSLIHCSQHPVEPSVAATAFSPTALPLLYHLLVDTFSQAALSPRRLDQFISEITKGCKILKWLVLLSGAHSQPPEQLPPPTPQSPLEQLLSVWLPWPPCQLFDVTHQSSIFPANLWWSSFMYPELWL